VSFGSTKLSTSLILLYFYIFFILNISNFQKLTFKHTHIYQIENVEKVTPSKFQILHLSSIRSGSNESNHLKFFQKFEKKLKNSISNFSRRIKSNSYYALNSIISLLKSASKPLNMVTDALKA
jgi:hypothetical protein